MTRPGHCLGRARLRRPRSGDNLEFMGVLLARRMFSSVPVTVAPFRPARIPRDQPEKKAHSPIDLLPVADDVQVYDRPLYVVANSVVAYAVSPLSHRDPSEFAAPIRIGLNTLEGTRFEGTMVKPGINAFDRWRAGRQRYLLHLA